jgi:hypothetical protein
MKISHRSSSLSIIISGILGFIAYGFLMFAVLGRGSGTLNQSEYVLMFNLHDAVTIFQFLFLIPLVFAFYNLSLHQVNAMTLTVRRTGLFSIFFVAFTLLLVFPGVLSNGITLVRLKNQIYKITHFS